MDISVVISSQNPSIIEAINYCKTRNLNIEVIDSVDKAIGEYVCIVDSFTYYQPYYLHYQWVALNFKNRKCNSFEITKAVCYDQNAKEFYVGDYTSINQFYRKSSGKTKPRFVEDNIFMVATVMNRKELPELLPPDSELVKYHEFFVGVLVNGS